MRLYKAVIATWLAVSALFVLALVLDAPSTTVTVLMAGKLSCIMHRMAAVEAAFALFPWRLGTPSATNFGEMLTAARVA